MVGGKRANLPVWIAIALIPALSACSSLAAQILFTNHWQDPSEPTWPFTPEVDHYDDTALLDLRFLNEDVAGQSGFVRRSSDGEDFVTGDGSSLRFWAVNSQLWQRSPEDLPDHARFLAKRGVNMVRWHGNIPSQQDGAGLSDIAEEDRERLWRMVAVMKNEGIYVTISPYYSLWLNPQPQWATPRSGDSMDGLLFFDPELQTAYKAWLKQLLEPVNPYTGIALKDDPAIAILQLQNEDSLLFWTIKNIKGDDLALLQRQFGQWLTAKYGGLKTLKQVWSEESLDDTLLRAGLVELSPLWELAQDPLNSAYSVGKVQRLADQTAFLTETMRQFNAEMVQFLRNEIGTPVLINAGNWKTADPLRLNDAERYSYAVADVIGVNRYYGGVHQGEKAGWAITTGDRFTDESVLTHPWQFPLNLKQVAGYPMIVSESSWTPPLSYQSEAPFLVSIFQSLTGVDAFYWFTTQDSQWRQPSSANGYFPSLGKWVFNTPELLGNFPAAALMYRQGYIQAAQPVVEDVRSVNDLWQRRSPLIAETPGFDPNRDTALRQIQQQADAVIHPLSFLVGPITATYVNEITSTQTTSTGTTSLLPVLQLNQYIDSDRQIVRSVTGEIKWDYRDGLCSLDAPKAQGVTGFLADVGAVELSDIAVKSNNDYGTVVVVSLDGKDIAQSNRVLVQVGTRTRPTGWQTEKIDWTDDHEQAYHGYKVVSYGEAPWQVENADMQLIVRNNNLVRAIALDMNGMARYSIPLEKRWRGQFLQIPPDAKYIILEGD